MQLGVRETDSVKIPVGIQLLCQLLGEKYNANLHSMTSPNILKEKK